MSYNLRSERKSTSPKTYQFHNYAFPVSQAETSFSQITNINDLKKITPRVKVLNQETPTLQSPKKPLTVLKGKTAPSPKICTEAIKNDLKKYCRTCAGVKYPLVDIFSEKGTQMRLHLQIKHLENIKEDDSLSTQMCMDCICDLKMSYTFFVQIKKAEMKLKTVEAKLQEAAALKAKENPPLIQHDPINLKNNGPRIAAVFSTNPVDWEGENSKIKENNPEGEKEAKVKLKSEKVDSDNESIEEFDPDDPPFDPESEADEDSESLHPFKKTLKKLEDNKTPEKKTPIVPEAEKNQEKEKETDVSLKRKIENPKIKQDSKIRKFNVQDALNIKTEENGVMYVTVRGEKPNELLLVKVKKMDKPGKKPDNRTLDEKGQFIEDQIEQYKKKREIVLGPQGKEKVTEIRIKQEVETIPSGLKNKILLPADKGKKSEKAEKQKVKPDTKKVTDVKNPEKPIEFTPIPEENIKLEMPEIKQETSRSSRIKDRKKPIDVKVYNNAEDYNNRLESLKQKWEDKQRKDWEETNPGVESPLDRLKRVLGDRAIDENLHEFIDNLQQRKMIIAKLSDEDLISLFKERLATKIPKEQEPEFVAIKQEDFDEFPPLAESYDCDFCFSDFPTKEVCDEHMKCHDRKFQYFCEDCSEEFANLRIKKNHNVICIRKLICKYCDLMLDSKGKKKQHEQKHCDSLFGQLCEFCGEKFKHQGTLDQHVKTKHMTLEKIFQCPKCPKKFAFKTKLSFHLKSVHTSLRAYLCEDCGADFKNPASLRHHRIRKHLPSGNKRECPVCRKMIPFYSLSKHMHTHKAYTIKCPHCDKMFKNSSTLKQHVRIHEDQRQFRCDTCGVGFNRRDGLRLHMKVHEKSDSRGLKECSCQICGEKFPNHSMLVIHRNRIHKDGRNYTCHICNRSMISTRSLEWHLAHIHNEPLPGVVKAETPSGSDSKRVSCFHCHKTFKTEMILRTHIKNSHMEKEPVKCLDCDETFVSEVRLRHHMMVQHNRLEGTLECPHCPKRFVNQLRLKTHMIAHSEERPFQCDICGFNLKTKIQLIKHHQNRHSDERPLQCRYCPWRCKQVSALVCHERTHTNERPYSCSVCRQRFKYLGDKNKHERRHESLGGSGFKRIVTNRGPKKNKITKEEDDTSNSEQEQLEAQLEQSMEEEQMIEEDDMETMEMEARLVDVAYEVEENVKIEGADGIIDDDYQTEYEEIAKDDSAVIMNMEDTNVYTEEVTAENIETTHIIEDEMMASQILQSGTVVHIEQHDEEGKIQVIPVVLSLPDLTEENSEVNLATTSIMYNNEEE